MNSNRPGTQCLRLSPRVWPYHSIVTQRKPSGSIYRLTPSGNPSRSHPFPPDWTVGAGLEAFLHENDYSIEQYDAPRTPASLLGISFSVPNTARHRWAIMLHDLHHVATGFGTDAVGEGEISAWEFRRGIRPLGLYVGSIVIGGVFLGLLVAPRRTLRAWRASERRPSLFHLQEFSYTDLLALTIGELRDLLGLPAEGLSLHPRRLHSLATRCSPDP